MPGTPTPEQESDDSGSVRALIALINDACLRMGTRLAFPQFAGTPCAVAGPTDIGRVLSMQMAVDVASVPSKAGRGRSGRTARPHAAPEPELEPTEVDEQHVETWRLVRLAQEGDGEAFGQLYDRYVDTVYRFVYYRVNDRALAEDFTSETFLRALRRISTISYQGRDIGAWFVTIARNIVLDHMKSARHRLEITTADTVEGNDREPSPEAAVLDSLDSQRLMAAVGQLGDEQRECVMLRFIQGFSVSETASVMGKNDGAIKALQHRAVRKLAELVGSELR